MFSKIIHFSLFFFICTSSFSSNNTKFFGEFIQGGIVIGKNSLAKKVLLDNNELMLSDNGYFIFGFGRNHKKNSILKIIEKNTDEPTLHKINVKKRNYKIEIIDGLPPKMVSPGPEILKKIKKDRLLIGNGLNKSLKSKIFPLSFIKPVEGRTSGVFGSQRILNGIKKNPHGGMDIAAPVGTPIKSISDGKVFLAEKDLYYTGNLVIVGHGYGLKSMYMHMNDIYVKNGDLVKQGQEIGTVGMTGRVTGPHLHWNVYWNKIKIDPEILLLISK